MMSNLGDLCDMKSCHLCDTCKYDEEFVKQENENIMDKRLFCNGCPRLEKLKVHSSNMSYYNLYCKDNPSNGARKLIDVSIPENKNFDTPKWCPLNVGIKETPSTTIKVKKNWYNLEAQIDFKDIKEGDIYHVPPYDGHKRKDIVITYRTEYSATYKILNEQGNGYVVNTLFPNTPLMRVLTTHKIQDIKVQKK